MRLPRPRSDDRREGGQVLVLVVLLATVLLGMGAIAIDVGSWYAARQDVQSAADFAALDGARALPTGQSAAVAAAGARYLKNGRATDNVSTVPSTYQSANDSVTVTASRIVPTFFMRLFGRDEVTVKGTARATVQSFSSLTSNHNIMPWGVLQGTFTPGQQVPIYTDWTSTANNGALSMPYQAGSSCPAANTPTYSDILAGRQNACAVTVGETIDTDPGSMAGPTSQGLNDRITTHPWQTLSQIARQNPDGTFDLVDPNSPQLVLMPVVVDVNGAPTWPKGRDTMRVVGFAWFAILSCGDPAHPSYCSNNDGKQVNGVFLRLASTTSNYTTTSWNGTANTAYTYSLTQ